MEIVRDLQIRQNICGYLNYGYIMFALCLSKICDIVGNTFILMIIFTHNKDNYWRITENY